MSKRNRPGQEGTALIFALGLLSIILITGFALYRGMELERQEMLADQAQMRASWIAKSGIESAVAQLESAIASGKTGDLLASPLNVDVPVYVLPRYVDENAETKVERFPSKDMPVIDSMFAGRANVTITDESAKINVNLAPPTVLMSLLKIDGDKARQIRERLPRLDGTAPGAGDENRRWLATVEELVSNGLVTSETLTAERAADLTVHSAGDMQADAAIVNVNTASSAVLEAALGITPDIASQVMLARPINSVDALKVATGKEPSGYNYKPGLDNPTGVAREIGFASRCFRIVSKGAIEKLHDGAANEVQSARAIEAVVYFPDNAAPRVVYWNESATPKATK